MTDSAKPLDPSDPRSPLYYASPPEGSRPAGDPPFWTPGTQIWWRYGHRSIHPMTVVRDDEAGLVAWLAGGTPITRAVRLDGSDNRTDKRDMFTTPRATEIRPWRGTGTLRIAPTGLPWSVWLFWHEDGTFADWYVNLEEVHVRDAHSTYSRDRVLDLVVAPDRTVSWKDADELELAVAAGRFAEAEAASFYADGHLVIELVERWASPFCDGWEKWRPDPTWPIPRLPEGTTADFGS